MSANRRPIGFIAAADPDSARAFYENTLNLRLLEQSPYALVFDDGGAMLRVQIVPALTPAAHTVHGWQVTDIDAEIRELSAKGVAFLKFTGMDQSDLGVWTTPVGDKIAWFKDPVGNILSLTQFAAL